MVLLKLHEQALNVIIQIIIQFLHSNESQHIWPLSMQWVNAIIEKMYRLVLWSAWLIKRKHRISDRSDSAILVFKGVDIIHDTQLLNFLY